MSLFLYFWENDESGAETPNINSAHIQYLHSTLNPFHMSWLTMLRIYDPFNSE